MKSTLSIFCAGLAFIIAIAVAMGSWTASEVGYVIGLAKDHVVHFPIWAGILLNIIFNGLAVSFDVVVFILRTTGVI